MEIDLTKRLSDSRITRVIIGKPSSMDISEIFELNTKDALSGDLITHENFDEDDIFYIQDIGYCKRTSLVLAGARLISCSSLYESIFEANIS